MNMFPVENNEPNGKNGNDVLRLSWGAMQRHSSVDAEANQHQHSTTELMGSHLQVMQNGKYPS